MISDQIEVGGDSLITSHLDRDGLTATGKATTPVDKTITMRRYCLKVNGCAGLIVVGGRVRISNDSI